MIALEIIIFLVCLICSAFFSGIETGMVSINRLRLRHLVEDEDDKSAVKLEVLLNNFDQLFGTTLIGNNFFNVIIAVISARVGYLLLFPYSEVSIQSLTAIIVLIFGEYLPKAWFQGDPIIRCRPFAGLLWLISVCLKPLSDLLIGVTNLFFRGLPGFQMRQRLFVSRDEISILAKESAEYGNLTPKQRIMIHRVVELAGKTAAQIMVPRSRMVYIDSQSTATDFFNQARESNFTRLPVFDKERQTFVGIVNLFDVLAAPPEQHGEKVGRFMRPPQFLRDIIPITEVLPRLRYSRQPLALITNAKAQVTGLLTTEDVLRHIIGTG